MATKAERADVKSLIRFYEKRGWDWSSAAEYLLWKYNGGGPYIIRTRIGVGYGRKEPRKNARITGI